MKYIITFWVVFLLACLHTACYPYSYDNYGNYDYERQERQARQLEARVRQEEAIINGIRSDRQHDADEIKRELERLEDTLDDD